MGAAQSIRLGDGGGKIDTAGGNLTLNTAGHLSGAGALTKLGTNSLIVSAANVGFSGPTNVTAGTLQMTNSTVYGPGNAEVAKVLGTSAITLNDGTTLQLKANGTGSTPQVLTYGNAVTLTGSATIDVNRQGGSNTNRTIALGPLSMGGGTLNVTGANTYSLQLDDLTLSGAATVNATTASVSVDNVNGAYALTKDGAGVLTVRGTLDGTVIVNGGTFAVAGTNAAYLGNVTLASGTTLRLGAWLDKGAGAVLPTLVTGSKLEIAANPGPYFDGVHLPDGSFMQASTSGVTYASDLIIDGTVEFGETANNLTIVGNISSPGTSASLARRHGHGDAVGKQHLHEPRRLRRARSPALQPAPSAPARSRSPAAHSAQASAAASITAMPSTSRRPARSSPAKTIAGPGAAPMPSNSSARSR